MNTQDEAACLGAFLGALLREGLRDTAPAPSPVIPAMSSRVLPDYGSAEYERQRIELQARQDARRMQSQINDLASQNRALAELLAELIRQASASGRSVDMSQLRATAQRLLADKNRR